MPNIMEQLRKTNILDTEFPDPGLGRPRGQGCMPIFDLETNSVSQEGDTYGVAAAIYGFILGRFGLKVATQIAIIEYGVNKSADDGSYLLVVHTYEECGVGALTTLRYALMEAVVHLTLDPLIRVAFGTRTKPDDS